MGEGEIRVDVGIAIGDAGTSGSRELGCWETRLACDATSSRRSAGQLWAIGHNKAVLNRNFGVGKNIDVVGFSEVVAAHGLAFLGCCGVEEWGGWCGWQVLSARAARNHVSTACFDQIRSKRAISDLI